jgi:hypothetical protein
MGALQRLAAYIWGLWQLAGELLHLIDVVASYPYPPRYHANRS